MTETDRYERIQKFEAMRPYLPFRAHSLGYYETLARLMGRNIGHQPITNEKQIINSRTYPMSRPFYA